MDRDARLFDHSRLPRIFLSALLITFALLFPITRPVDPDVWFHLSAGRFLWNHGTHPGLDHFLYSFPADGSSNHHEWLFQALVYPLYRLLGMESLVALKTVLVAAPFLFLFFSSVTRRSFYPGLFYLLAAFAAGSGRFHIRPEIAGAAIMVVMWRLLSRPLTLRRGLIFVLLQILWTNIHWSSLLGAALVAAFAAADTAGRLIPDRSRWTSGTGCAHRAGYSLLLAGVLAATLVSPDGFRPLVEPFRFFFGTDFLLPIAEVQPMYADLLKRGVSSYRAWFFLALSLGLLVFCLSWRRINLAHLFTFLGMALVGVSAGRHVLFFALVSVPIVISALNALAEERGRAPSRAVEFILPVAAAFFLTTITMNKLTGANQLIPYPRPYEPLSAKDSELLWPHRAAAFVVGENLPGRIFNNFNSGNFLNWAVFPRRIYVNGTIFHRPTEVEYAGLSRNPGRWEEFARKWGVETAFFRLTPLIAPSPLVRRLLGSPKWTLVFYDGTAAVFLKEGAENQRLTADFAVDLDAELRAAVEALPDTVGEPSRSGLPFWGEISYFNRRRDQARLFRLRGRFYLLADRPDLAEMAVDIVRRLGA